MGGCCSRRAGPEPYAPHSRQALAAATPDHSWVEAPKPRKPVGAEPADRPAARDAPQSSDEEEWGTWSPEGLQVRDTAGRRWALAMLGGDSD